MKKTNFWWLLTIAGGILIITGFFSLADSLNAYIFLVHYSGLVLLLNGIMLIIVSYTGSAGILEKEWLLAESVLDILFAVCLLFNPFMSFIAFAFLIGPWMIAKGILKSISALKLKQIRGWGFILTAGLLSILFGFLIIFYPMKKANDITFFLGSFLLVIGSLYIFNSIRFRKLSDTLDLMI